MLHKSKLYLKRNASTILTCVSAAGVVSTTYLAVKATPKAIKILEQAEQKKGERLTNSEVVVSVVPIYLPSIISGTVTIVSIFGANILNKRQQAALTSAYALLSNSYKEYKDKVAELYGDDIHDEIQTEIAKDNYKESDIKNDDTELFYDVFSKQYFESTLFKVQQAEYYINRDLVMRDYAYLNEFYEYLDIEPIDSGWKLGWSTGSCLAAYWQPWLDFNHTKFTMGDGTECIKITMFQEPFADFENYE